MNREQLMKMSKKELKARLVTVGKEAQAQERRGINRPHGRSKDHWGNPGRD